MFGFVRFSAVATAPGFVLFPNWGNWRAVEFATGFATPVPRTTGCVIRCVTARFAHCALRDALRKPVAHGRVWSADLFLPCFTAQQH